MVEEYEEEDKEYVGFHLEVNYLTYIKRLSKHPRSSFNNKSAIIRHCIKKHLLIMLDEVGIKHSK